MGLHGPSLAHKQKARNSRRAGSLKEALGPKSERV